MLLVSSEIMAWATCAVIPVLRFTVWDSPILSILPSINRPVLFAQYPDFISSNPIILTILLWSVIMIRSKGDGIYNMSWKTTKIELLLYILSRKIESRNNLRRRILKV
jgi:hypothetical protein